MVHGHIHNNITSPAFKFLKTQDRALNGGVILTILKQLL